MILRFTKYSLRLMKELRGYGGFCSYVRGCFSAMRKVMLRRKYKFSAWHVSPYHWRAYAMELTKEANKLVKKEGLQSVAEVGCGLGEIIKRIEAPKRTGIDMEAEVIQAAKRKSKGVEFETGSFEKLYGKNLDMLISVNFPHAIAPEELKPIFAKLAETVRYFWVDRVHYQYFHDYDKIMPNSHKRLWTGKTHGPEKHQVMLYGKE